MSSSSLVPRVLVLCVAGVLLLTAPALGAVGRWSLFGPPAGQIQEVLADPAVPGLLYGLMPAGVFRSADGGLTWGSASAGLPHGITALAVDPQRPGRLWAASSSSVFRSDDRGDHWKRVSGADFQPFPPSGPVAGVILLAVLPGKPAVLFFAGHGYLDVWRSGDGGRTWSTVPGVRDVLYLKTDPAGRIYAVQNDWSLWRSDDAGLTWRQVTVLPEYARDFAAGSSGRRSVLYASYPHALYRSRNRGTSWQIVLPAPEEGSIGALAVDPRRPETVYVMVYQLSVPHLWVSDDAGTSWRRMPGRPPFTITIRKLLIEPQRRMVYILSWHDLISSRDRGRTWTQMPMSAPMYSLNSHLRFDPADPSRIFAVIGDRLFRSSNGGRTWRYLREGTDLAFDPARPRFLYLAAGDLLLSKDGGLTWTPVSRPSSPFERIAFPSRSHLVVAGWGLSRSSDRGRTWTQTLSGDISPTVFRNCDRLAADPRDPQRFFARCFYVTDDGYDTVRYGTAIWRSVDGGWTWTELPGLRGVAFDPVQAGTVYGWTYEPYVLFRSQDGGSTWEQVGEPREHGWAALLVDPWSPEVFYAGRSSVPILERSRDGGVTWEPLQAGAATSADGLWAHPTIPHQIYLVDSGESGGFYEARFPEE